MDEPLSQEGQAEGESGGENEVRMRWASTL